MPGGGPHPSDQELFAADQLAALRTAASELRFLRERGYSLTPTLKLVGDRHQLRDRQRIAIRRATSEAAGASDRTKRRAVPTVVPEALWVDGFNVVITCETALNGGVLVTTLDGGLRDLAGIHGSYRLSPTTDEALAHLAGQLATWGWKDVPTRWLLDAPVSNTGRLAARVREVAESSGFDWTVEVVPDPDPVLAKATDGVVVATSDAVVLDRCRDWIDLAGETVRARVSEAWIVDLQLD